MAVPARSLSRAARPRLDPPLYPGAALGMMSQGNSAGLVTEERAYLVEADVLAVTLWLEKVMPGFVPCHGATEAACWINERCEEPLEGMLVLRLT